MQKGHVRQNYDKQTLICLSNIDKQYKNMIKTT